MAIWVTKAICLFSIVSAAPAGNYLLQQQPQQQQQQQQQLTVVSQSAPSSQYHAQDELGQYSYGYTNSDGQSKAEVKGIDGSIAGKYSYIDANGKKVEVSYVADEHGFRAVGDHLPSHDMTPLAKPPGSENNEVSAQADHDEEDESGGKKKKTSGEKEEKDGGGGEEEEEEEEEEDEDETEDEEGEEEEKENENENENEGGKENEAAEQVESVKIPEATPQKQVQQHQLPAVYAVAQRVQQPLAYAGQPTTLYRVSNVPMTIQTSSASGQSRPQLVYVARAVHLSQHQLPAMIDHQTSAAAKSHSTSSTHVQQQHQRQQPLVNQPYLLATRESSSSSTGSTDAAKGLQPGAATHLAVVPMSTPAVPVSATTAYQLIQPTPIRATQRSFHTYVPALPSAKGHNVKHKSGSGSGSGSGAKIQKSDGQTSQTAGPSAGQVLAASQYLQQMALLPGYGYIPAQYSVFQ